MKELPPRARRIPRTPDFTSVIAGTTSACAENTCSKKHWTRPAWNYLRVRGEYDPLSTTEDLTKELPPRARRILLPPTPAEPENGTTSACAENTGGEEKSSDA